VRKHGQEAADLSVATEAPTAIPAAAVGTSRWPPAPDPPAGVRDVAAAVAVRLVCLEEAVKLATPGEGDLVTLTRAARFERYALDGT
jgi:hypothetical protein